MSYSLFDHYFIIMNIFIWVIFGVITGLIMQWKESNSTGKEFVKSGVLGGAGTGLGGLAAYALFTNLTNFSLASVILLIITAAGAIVISNTIFQRRHSNY
jgi:uncharacterized membrane protein YeaQ/YmgE (transglycosylase-associated protein family)